MERLHDLVKQAQSLNEEINALKDKLAAEDYKVTKCAEAQLQGKEMPYDVEELTTRRDGYRQEVRDKTAELLAIREKIKELLELMSKMVLK